MPFKPLSPVRVRPIISSRGPLLPLPPRQSYRWPLHEDLFAPFHATAALYSSNHLNIVN